MVVKNRAFRFVLMLLAVSLALVASMQPLSEGAAPTIVFKDPNPKDVSFTYDGDGRWVDIYHRFYVNSAHNEYVYFKIAPEEGNDWYMNGIVEEEEGWYVSFYMETGEGSPLQYDADGNPIDAFLGTRTDATPTPTVLLAPDTVYTLHLKVHVGSGLPYGIRTYGSVLLAVKAQSSGSGGIPDPSMEFRVYMTPVNTYPISGMVYYKDKNHPAVNATLTLKNKATGETMEGRSNDMGAYSFDLSNLDKGWHNGDTIVITAEYRGLKGKREVTVDIAHGRSRADLILKEERPVDLTWALLAATGVLVGIGAGASYIYLRKRPSEPGRGSKDSKTSRLGQPSQKGKQPPQFPSHTALRDRPTYQSKYEGQHSELSSQREGKERSIWSNILRKSGKGK